MNEIKVHTGRAVTPPPAAVVFGLWAARLIRWIERGRAGPRASSS